MSRKIQNAIGLYLEGIRDGRPRDAVAKYTGARYKQHSTGVRDGQDGFIEFFEPFIERNPIRDIQVIRALEDGRYVFVHVFQSLGEGESEWVTTDFFDTDDDDKIVEHWDVIAPFAAATPSGHSAVDGPTQITDSDRIKANKAIVQGLFVDVLMDGGDPTAIDGYISADTYTQHSSQVADGLDAFKAVALGAGRLFVYEEVVLLVGQGNFVATLCRTRRDGEPFAHVDLFRLQDSLIVEHWDNAEPVPPRREWANSGKF
jgi:predicted SnoaL-like aldol condensation-catalyzing enzyme